MARASAGGSSGSIRALAAAFLFGAAGAATQALLLRAAGTSLGHGLALPAGLAAWFAGFALGAALSARLAGRVRAVALLAGAALPALAHPVLVASGARGSTAGSAAVALLVVLATAVPQGLWFAPLARRLGGLWLLWCVDLAGAALGLHVLLEVLPRSRPLGETALWASACGVAASVLALLALREAADTVKQTGQASPDATRSGSGARWWWAAAFGAAGVVALELAYARICAALLGGLQPAHNATLLGAQLALFAGAAALPWLLPQRSSALAWLALGAATGAALLPEVLRRLAPALGAESAALLPQALGVGLPLLCACGALLPCLARAAGESRTAALLSFEGLGALACGPLVALVVVPRLGLSAAIAAGIVALAACAACASSGERRARPALLLALGAAAWIATRPSPVLATTPFRNAAFEFLSFDEDRDYAVAVVDDGIEGERTLLTDSFRAAGTGPDYRYMQALGHIPLLLHQSPRAVGVLALGTGTTLGAVALHEAPRSIEVLELSRAVLDAAPFFADKHHGALDAPLERLLAREGRVGATIGDGRATLARGRAYDVLTMEPLLPDAPGAVYLYTREFYALARRALNAGGLLVQWIPTHALEPATCDALVDTFAASFECTTAFVVGTQTILVGSSAPPSFDVPGARRAASLQAELVGLGLADAEGLAAACVGRLEARPGARLVTDADPWIVHAPRRHGARLLFDLGENLRRLRLRATPPPGAPSDEAARRASQARSLVRLARERFADETARLANGGIAPADAGSSWREAVAEARLVDARDAELEAFEREARFVVGLREGATLLSLRDDAEGARAALGPLLDAAEARPERADVHAWTALALERAGSGAWQAALAKAGELCPGIGATRTAERLRALSPSAQFLARLDAHARRDD